MQHDFKPHLNDQITVEYHGELMENFFSESTISALQGLKAIKYHQDLALLLFINTDNRLCAITQVNNTHSGWSLQELSPAQLKVCAFDLYHDAVNNRLKIAYSRINEGKSQLLLSNDLQLSKIDPLQWTQDLRWNQIKINNTDKQIDHISMNQQGLLFSTEYRHHDATYQYFRYGETPQEYTLPENTAKVIQLEVGQFDYDFGVFLLYRMQGENTMIFQSFPDQEANEVCLYRFKPCPDIRRFTLIDDHDGNDQLYLAGDGIFTYVMEDGNSQPTKSIVCASGQGVIFSKIEVSSNQDTATIWTIGEKDQHTGLYYLTNKFYESAQQHYTQKWTAPLQMQEAIEEFSSIKGNAFGNQLFLLGNHENTNSLIHFWQDEQTTGWHEHPVVVQDLEKLNTLETFTINVQFKSDPPMRSFHGEKVRVSAEANLLVYIGGKKVAIGLQQYYEATIEDDYINIVYPTNSVAASNLYIEADFLPSKVTIDPARQLKTEIKLKFGDQTTLKNAKLPNGEPLIDPHSVSDQDLEQMVKATHQAYAHIDQLDQLPSVAAHPNLLAATMPQETFGLSSIGNAFGDVWHAIKKGFVEAADFIVETVKDGVKFVIKIAGEVFEWVSQAVSDVFHFLERVWEKVKVFFKNVFEYLAFLFNWEDILHTKRVMKQHFSNIILGLADEIGHVKQKTYDYFEEVKDKLEDIKREISLKQLDDQSFGERQAGNQKSEKIDPRANWMGTKKSHITHSQTQQQVVSAIPSATLTSLSSASTRLAQHFEVLGQQLMAAFSDLSGKFMDVINSKMKIGDFLEYLVLTLLELGVAIAQEIIDLIFEILEVAVRSVEKILNAEISIPFFSYLYKKISGDELSVNDLICLLIAVPMTALYKIGEGEAPFKDEGEKQKFVDAGKSIFKLTA